METGIFRGEATKRLFTNEARERQTPSLSTVGIATLCRHVRLVPNSGSQLIYRSLVSVFFFARIRSDAFADSGGFLDRELFQNAG